MINQALPSTSGYLGQQIAADALATYPCEGVSSVYPIFGPEDPDPFPLVNRYQTPYGQPVYMLTSYGTKLTLVNGSITLRNGGAVPVTVLNNANDPQKRLQSNQVFLVPTQRLADNSTYDVALSGTHSGLISTANPTGAFTRNFSFTTGTPSSE